MLHRRDDRSALRFHAVDRVNAIHIVRSLRSRRRASRGPRFNFRRTSRARRWDDRLHQRDHRTTVRLHAADRIRAVRLQQIRRLAVRLAEHLADGACDLRIVAVNLRGFLHSMAPTMSSISSRAFAFARRI